MYYKKIKQPDQTLFEYSKAICGILYQIDDYTKLTQKDQNVFLCGARMNLDNMNFESLFEI